MRIVTLPERTHGRDELAQVLAAIDCRHAAQETGELELVGTECQAHFHSAVAAHG